MLDEKNWNGEAAAHLLNRAGFGGTPEAIEQLRVQGAVDDLLQTPSLPVEVANRAWSTPLDLIEKRRVLRSLKGQPRERKAKRKELRKEQHSELQDLRAWWLERMMTTRAPLREKMTLFWHGHFATSAQKVKATYALWPAERHLPQALPSAISPPS